MLWKEALPPLAKGEHVEGHGESLRQVQWDPDASCNLDSERTRDDGVRAPGSDPDVRSDRRKGEARCPGNQEGSEDDEHGAPEPGVSDDPSFAQE